MDRNSFAYLWTDWPSCKTDDRYSVIARLLTTAGPILRSLADLNTTWLLWGVGYSPGAGTNTECVETVPFVTSGNHGQSLVSQTLRLF
ncbi:hypothetical protein F2P79_023274 [Pimephales promelas]|nr:hypothetical protein F2P79_023274 [Pimephales promelas]